MAIRLPGEELAKMKADFDAPETKPKEPIKKKAEEPEKKRRGGRPASPTPRNGNLHIRLSDADREKLEEAARITGKTKTIVIVEGIDYVFSKAIAEKRKQNGKETAKEAE